MTCRSTATSPCIWQRLLLLVLQRELAGLPLREDRLHLSAQVQRLDRVVDLEPERVALTGGDPFGSYCDLLARCLELSARCADVIENRRRVGEVRGDVAVDKRLGRARVGRVLLDRDLRLPLFLQGFVLGLQSGELRR